MKRELSLVKEADFNVRRGRSLDQLYGDFMRDHTLNAHTIEEIWSCLSPEEQKNSQDTVATLKMQSLMAEGKMIQAYLVLIAAFKADPTNLFLHLERSSCLSQCHVQLDRMLGDDPQNPLIDILYDIVLKEGFVGPVTQGRHLARLVRVGRYPEAVALAKPLIALYPGLIGLRDTVEDLVVHIPNETLRAYAIGAPFTTGRQVVNSVLKPQQTQKLMKAYYRLRGLLQNEPDNSNISRELNEILGDTSDLSPIDLSLKDFYHLKAILNSNRGRHWEAISILQVLVELDPCNFHFRRALEGEVQKFSEMVGKKSKSNELKIDLSRAYSILKEIATVPYGLLKHVCLSEVASGGLKSAKEKMDKLCALNPYDGDYLLAALDVAMEANDQEWLAELLGRLEYLKTERPWYLTVTAFETAE